MSESWAGTLTTEEGEVERIAPLNRWRGPAAVALLPAVDEIFLEPFFAFMFAPFRQATDEQYARTVESGLLLSFVQLHRANDDAVLAFAEMWGPLSVPGLVRQQRVSEWMRFQATLEELASPVAPARFGPEIVCEPVAHWRRAATIARHTLRIAACLHEGEPIEAEECAMLDAWSVPMGTFPKEIRNRHYIATGKKYIAGIVNQWVGEAGVRPVALYGKGAVPEFLLSTGSLGGALGVQLLLAITGAPSFAVCSECTNLYTPKRKPSAHTRCFCQTCRDAGVPQRLAQRDKKKRDADNAKKATARQDDNHADNQDEH